MNGITSTIGILSRVYINRTSSITMILGMALKNSLISTVVYKLNVVIHRNHVGCREAIKGEELYL